MFMGSVTVLACTFVLATANISYEKDCGGNADHLKLFPHENCHQFYLCVDGKLIIRDCADGLLYNRETQTCDWPENVACEQVKTLNIIENQNISPKTAATKCSKATDGLLLAHENCNQFYVCLAGKPIERYCAPGLLFNFQTQVCDWASNVVCGERKTLVSDSVTGLNNIHHNNKNVDSSDDSVRCAQAVDGSMITHENCNQFFICVAGIAIELFCTPGTFFDAQKQVCDWSFNVNCDGRLVSKSDSAIGLRNVHLDSTNFDTSDALAGCAEADDGAMIAHENCEQFYVCLAGNPVALYCPLGLFYNPQKQLCDWSFNVDCNERIMSKAERAIGFRNIHRDSTFSDSSDVAATCAHAVDGSVIAHENCNQFYICVAGISIEMVCTPGTLFDSQKQLCDLSFNVNCDGRIDLKADSIIGLKNVHLDSTNMDSSYALTICAQTGDGSLIAHENCDQFYVCLAGNPIALYCPLGLFYNPQKQVCDWSFNVDCERRILLAEKNHKNEEIEDKSDATVTCAENPHDNIFIAHQMCDHFYVCRDGKPVTLKCPKGLFFNSAKNVCDWPANVVCNRKE